MDLLLWRHAEAEDGDDDMKRRLTERGQKQAQAMAAWIRAHQPKNLRIIASPAVRTQQTAAALDLPFETHRQLGPEALVSDLIAVSGWPDAAGATLIVGHQPSDALGVLFATGLLIKNPIYGIGLLAAVAIRLAFEKNHKELLELYGAGFIAGDGIYGFVNALGRSFGWW